MFSLYDDLIINPNVLNLILSSLSICFYLSVYYFLEFENISFSY